MKNIRLTFPPQESRLIEFSAKSDRLAFLSFRARIGGGIDIVLRGPLTGNFELARFDGGKGEE